MVACLQDADQLTVVCVIFVRLKNINIRFRPLTVNVRVQVQVALVVMPFQFGQDSPVCKVTIWSLRKSGCAIVPLWQGYAVAVEYRLYFQAEGKRADTSFGHFQLAGRDGGGYGTFRHGDGILILMATDTGYDLAGHAGQPASHPLDGGTVLIQRLDRDRGVGRYFEHSRSVFFYGDGSENALDVPSALNALGIVVGRSEDIGIFVSEDTEGFDRSAGNTLCAFAFIDILYEYGRFLFSRI